jgi:hypothetical protein
MEAPQLATRLDGLFPAIHDSETAAAASDDPSEPSAADPNSTDAVCPADTICAGEPLQPESAQQQSPATDDTLSQQALKLVNVREQLEELLPLRAESAESMLTIAGQRLKLAAQQEEIQRLRDQGTGLNPNRRAA